MGRESSTYLVSLTVFSQINRRGSLLSKKGESMDRKYKLWVCYCDDLNDYGADIKDFDILLNYDAYIRSESEWLDVTDSKGKLIGFVIIGTGDNCRPDCDYYIAETYIDRRHRRNGIMKKFITEYIKAHPGRYCLFILDKNVPAKFFWKSIEKELCLKPLTFGENDTEGCSEYGFEYDNK